MSTPLLAPPSPTAEGHTERFDPIDCLDERMRSRAAALAELGPGRYLQVEGPERTLTIPLDQQVLRVGRGLSADLRLDERSVSRRHAIIESSGPVVRILDEHSSNGTWVNGVAVQQAELHHGDRIAVGRVALRYLEL